MPAASVRRRGGGDPEPSPPTSKAEPGRVSSRARARGEAHHRLTRHGPRGVAPAAGAGLAGQRRQDVAAQTAWSERRAGCPQRASGDAAGATPSRRRKLQKCLV